MQYAIEKCSRCQESERNCVCSYFLYGHMWLHCTDMLLCPDLRLKTASSSNWGGSPTSFSNSKYLFLSVCLFFIRILSGGKESSQDPEKAKPASIAELLSVAKERGSEVDVSVLMYGCGHDQRGHNTPGGVLVTPQLEVL